MRHLLAMVLLAMLVTACGLPAPPAGAPPATGAGDDGRQTSAARPPAGTPRAVPPRAEPTGVAPSPGDTRPAASQLFAADRPRLEPVGDAVRTDALVRGLNGFAFDLYRAAVAEDGGNLIYSPYSIAQAFSMVYAGARGRTEAQMADVLGFLPQQRHHPAANALDLHLAALDSGTPPAGEEQGEAFALRNANAVWGQRGFPFEDAYLRTLAEQYGAGVRTVDFAADPEGGRRAVNAWVKDRTEGRIADVVPQGVIDTQTRLVLANAIYFKAGWLYPFEEGTEDAPFTLLNGNRVTVPMMRQETEPVPYAEGDGYQAVVLPYAGNTVEMVVVVPKVGRFEAIEARMNADFLARVRAASENGNATVSMPHFKFESALNLRGMLPGMGMPDAFQPGTADFGGITRNTDLFISAAIHRATIAADEKGTEATAATALVIREVGAPAEPPPHLTIDRPFVFAIVERETGAILFMGRVTNPTE